MKLPLPENYTPQNNICIDYNSPLYLNRTKIDFKGVYAALNQLEYLFEDLVTSKYKCNDAFVDRALDKCYELNDLIHLLEEEEIERKYTLLKKNKSNNILIKWFYWIDEKIYELGKRIF